VNRMRGKWTYISVKSGEMASTSISPVMLPLAWFEKCRNRVISRRARLANCIFSKTRVTSLIATVSPEISSAAELSEGFEILQSESLAKMYEHDDSVSPRAQLPYQFPASFQMKDLIIKRGDD
jgi:hypothetical protein